MRLRRLLKVGICLVVVLFVVFGLGIGVQNSAAMRFGASLNQTLLSPGQILHLSMISENVLPFTNNPPELNGWPVENMSSGAPCGPLFPFGIAVYRGTVTVENTSKGSSVAVFDYSGLVQCANLLQQFWFWPFETIMKNTDLQGFWTREPVYIPSSPNNSGGTVYPYVLHPFSPGVYTLFAGDVWGNLSVKYFTVLSG